MFIVVAAVVVCVEVLMVNVTCVGIVVTGRMVLVSLLILSALVVSDDVVVVYFMGLAPVTFDILFSLRFVMHTLNIFRLGNVS